MPETIDPAAFPDFTELVENYLCVGEHDGLDGAVDTYFVVHGVEAAQRSIEQITRLLDEGYGEEAIRQFMTERAFPRYYVDDSAVRTMEYIREALQRQIPNQPGGSESGQMYPSV